MWLFSSFSCTLINENLFYFLQLNIRLSVLPLGRKVTIIYIEARRASILGSKLYFSAVSFILCISSIHNIKLQLQYILKHFNKTGDILCPTASMMCTCILLLRIKLIKSKPEEFFNESKFARSIFLLPEATQYSDKR